MGAKTTDIYMIQALFLSMNVGEDFMYGTGIYELMLVPLPFWFVFKNGR